MENKTLTITDLNTKIRSKLDLYSIISRIYKLPRFTSKAITKNYLKAYLELPCPVFRIKVTEFRSIFVPTIKFTAEEILEGVEGLLLRKKLPCTGLTRDTLPDLEWLIGTYFHLSPTDELNFFPSSLHPESSIRVTVDSE